MLLHTEILLRIGNGNMIHEKRNLDENMAGKSRTKLRKETILYGQCNANIYQIKESLLCRSALTEVNEGNRSQYIRGHTRQSKN